MRMQRCGSVYGGACVMMNDDGIERNVEGGARRLVVWVGVGVGPYRATLL